MSGHQQPRGLFAGRQACADQALRTAQRQLALSQVLAHRAAAVIAQQIAVTGAVAVEDQADRLAVQFAQCLQFDQRRVLVHSQMLGIFTAGLTFLTTQQDRFHAQALRRPGDLL